VDGGTHTQPLPSDRVGSDTTASVVSVLYLSYMNRAAKSVSSNSVVVKVGGWFEASATGWGILVVPLVLALVLAAMFAHLAFN
jgi:hypothetical protein